MIQNDLLDILYNNSPANVTRFFMSSNQNSRPNNRSGRNNNKQNNRGRNQGGRGRKGPSRGMTQQPLTATRQVDSNGPAGKLRGNVKQLYDKYKELAIDNRTLDRTTSEAHGQYAHHYYTLYSEFAAAEAAVEAEREKEKVRRQEAATENQANVVKVVAEEQTQTDAVAVVSQSTVTQEQKSEVKPKRKPKPRSPEKSPELPLSADEAPEKPKRARKPKKVTEEVVE